MASIRSARLVLAMAWIATSTIPALADTLTAANRRGLLPADPTPTLIGVRADSLTAPRFDSTSAGIATVPLELGPEPGRQRKTSRWAQLLGPQVMGSFPVSSFGRATSPGAGVGIQLLVLGM